MAAPTISRAARSTTAAPDFDALYEEFAPRVRRLARRRLHNDELAEDVVQEAFLRAYRARGDLDPDRSPWPWLATVTTNLCNDLLRRGLLREEVALWDDAGEPAHGADTVVVEEPARQAIVDALTAIGERQRRVLVLHHVEGKPYRDIAAAEGVSLEAVRSILARGRRAFRSHYLTLAERRDLLPAALPVGAHHRLREALSPRRWLDRLHGLEARTHSVMGRAGDMVQGLAGSLATTAVLGGVAVLAPLAPGSALPDATDPGGPAGAAPPVVVERADPIAERAPAPHLTERVAEAPAPAREPALVTRAPDPEPAPSAPPPKSTMSGPGAPQQEPRDRPIDPPASPGQAARDATRAAQRTADERAERHGATEAETGADGAEGPLGDPPLSCRGDDRYVQPVCDTSPADVVGPVLG